MTDQSRLQLQALPTFNVFVVMSSMGKKSLQHNSLVLQKITTLNVTTKFFLVEVNS